jgi:hypothetical protein
MATRHLLWLEDIFFLRHKILADTHVIHIQLSRSMQFEISFKKSRVAYTLEDLKPFLAPKRKANQGWVEF